MFQLGWRLNVTGRKRVKSDINVAGPVPKSGEVFIDSRAMAQAAEWERKMGRFGASEANMRYPRTPAPIRLINMQTARKRVLGEPVLSLTIWMANNGREAASTVSVPRGFPDGFQRGFLRKAIGMILSTMPEPQAMDMRDRIEREPKKAELSQSSSRRDLTRLMTAIKKRTKATIEDAFPGWRKASALLGVFNKAETIQERARRRSGRPNGERRILP